MTNDAMFAKRLEELRRRAEARLAGTADDEQASTDAESKRLLHELHVHQIELEMQNEALREAHQSLEQSRDRYLELFHNAPLGYVVTDSAAIVLQANLTFSDMLDEAPDALVNRPLSRWIDPRDQTVFFSRFRAFHKDPSGQHIEIRLQKKDRTVVDVNLAGRRIDPSGSLASQHDRRDLLFITISDISRRKTAEAAIIRAKTQWEQTFDAVPELIAIVDAHGTVVRVNRALASRLGVTPAACIGKPYDDLFYGGGAPDDCPYGRMLATGRMTRSEGFNHMLNGHFIATATPYPGEDDDAVWCILVMHDITARKRIEEELLKLRNLESIGTLAGGIAHDFNNILTSLVGNIELAKLTLNDTRKAESFLGSAIEAAFRARDLANRLLTFSSGGDPRSQPVVIDQLLEAVVEVSLSGTNANYELHLAGPADPMIVDDSQLRSAFQNIITNAREAMPWGGTVVVRSTTVEAAPRNDSLMAAGTYVRIDVQDRGTGIRADHLEKIFDPYFTTKQMGAQKGMGLGLAISHSIVKRHHGYIAVDSSEGEGTTVTIHLPVHAGTAANRHIPRLRPTARTSARSRLLFLEDEKSIWRVVRPIVAQIDCDADFVDTGNAAIGRYERALKEGRPYDLLMLDLTIRGDVGAKTVIREILNLDPAARAAVFSGYTNDPVFTDYRRYGFIGALKKPFTHAQLQRFIQRMLFAGGPADLVN